VLEECAKFNEGVVAPLNWEGDRTRRRSRTARSTTPGFKEAFRQYVDGGWQGLQHPADFGGPGPAQADQRGLQRDRQSANISFALCPLLTDGAIEALLTAGSDEQKQTYIPPMIDGSAAPAR
jgi:alkylation response protein AidB-like acyl-CoA dehydrogenase